MRIGIDLDNTIIDYGALVLTAAHDMALLPAAFRGDKVSVRDRLRSRPGGEEDWQRLQAEIYGPRILEAVPYPGAESFLDFCARSGIAVAIVSHKTRRAAADTAGIDLHEAARGWLQRYRFVGNRGLTASDVSFATSRADKIRRIAELKCAIFIDDLTEVLCDPAFPVETERWLFSGHTGRPDTLDPALQCFDTWAAMQATLARRLP